MKKGIKSAVAAVLCFGPARLHSRRVSANVADARKTLLQFSSKPAGTPIGSNFLTESICDLQIIVPAYNVEDYLADCMESILSQKTSYTFRIILINDGSTDGTSEIADRYLGNPKVTVIHQKNQGLSGARNTGLKYIFGKYIMFVDSDDMLCPGAVESLLHTAFENNCDIVEGGAFSLKNGIRRNHYVHAEERFVHTALGTLHGFSWGKVFKADCFRNIIFPEGFWFEDSVNSFLIYPGAKRVFVIRECVYIYRRNPAGITLTSKGNPRAVDTYWITETLMEARNALCMPMDDAFMKKFIRQVILNQKRIAELPKDIQQSVFVLSSGMMRQYFSQEIIAANKASKLVQALCELDWGLFRLYCRCA